MLSRSVAKLGWHYVHPVTGRPLRQTRRFNDPRYINNEAALIKGQWGLITKDFGVVAPARLEEARIVIQRRLPKKYNVVMFTDYEETPIIARSKEARMGGGKGPLSHFAFKLSTGIPLFEIHYASPANLFEPMLTKMEAEIIFLPGRLIIPIQTVVVPRGRVHEFSVFK
jgi:ribosomal protein L16/L10AE